MILSNSFGQRQLSVWNNGSELPEEVLTNFGKLFYRMDKARSYKEQHYGIGLSFVCIVAKLHKGRVELRNRDEGAEVLITFNCVKSQWFINNPINE